MDPLHSITIICFLDHWILHGELVVQKNQLFCDTNTFDSVWNSINLLHNNVDNVFQEDIYSNRVRNVWLIHNLLINPTLGHSK